MHNEAANKTRSFNKNCPGAPERAGKPPADGSITPGVVSINVRVIKNVIADIKMIEHLVEGLKTKLYAVRGYKLSLKSKHVFFSELV